MENSRKRKAVECAEEKSGCLQAKSTVNITVLRWKALRVKKGRWEVAVSKTKLQRIFQLPSKDENNSRKRHDEEWCYRLFFLPDGNLTTVQCRSQVKTKSTTFLSTKKAYISFCFVHSVFSFFAVCWWIWLKLQIKNCLDMITLFCAHVEEIKKYISWTREWDKI